MKSLICILLSLWTHSLFSQKVIFYERKEAFYTNMENYVRYLVKDSKASSLVFKTDNGKIEPAQFAFLIFKPMRPGNTIIRIYQQQKNKLIPYDSINVMVYENNKAEALVGVKYGGAINKRELIAIGGLIGMYRTREDHTDPIPIKTYTIIFHKSDGTIQYQVNTGNRFNEPSIRLMNELQSGEKVTFTNIQAVIEGYPPLKVNPIEFTIQ
ncbi:hypothetical protein A3860_33915 [Niastella vici]|uniref:Gliding motility-associated protein GldM C-terminal domain-containing protein n=1 Tax=Niastella vici TaxID=1703345 RepID=A0A1V9FPT0_9BACT|nr:GldM family protein [Niastella vici]OQP60379.1 hypothetical protein A3860_33915 [Niastella vici]